METHPRGARSSPGTSKVAQVTFAFWVMKSCATTRGETAGDLLSMTLNVGSLFSSVILLSMFVVSLIALTMHRDRLASRRAAAADTTEGA